MCGGVQAKLRGEEGVTQADGGRSESLAKLATEWDSLRKILLSRFRELTLEAKAFVDKTPRKELMVKGGVAIGVLLVLITIFTSTMRSSSDSHDVGYSPGARGGTFQLDNVIDSVITTGPDMMAAENGRLPRGRKSLLSSPSSSSRKQTPLLNNRRRRPTAHWTSDSLPAVDARMQLPVLVLATSKDFVGGDGLILGVGAGAFAVQVLKVRLAAAQRRDVSGTHTGSVRAHVWMNAQCLLAAPRPHGTYVCRWQRIPSHAPVWRRRARGMRRGEGAWLWGSSFVAVGAHSSARVRLPVC